MLHSRCRPHLRPSWVVSKTSFGDESILQEVLLTRAEEQTSAMRVKRPVANQALCTTLRVLASNGNSRGPAPRVGTTLTLQQAPRSPVTISAGLRAKHPVLLQQGLQPTRGPTRPPAHLRERRQRSPPPAAVSAPRAGPTAKPSGASWRGAERGLHTPATAKPSPTSRTTRSAERKKKKTPGSPAR